ncbi:hypothetical protein GBA52_023935 [Prunus armeniaca]|nr:hypothetical protein GBA52_023935 [Prunus armeniaca]
MAFERLRMREAFSNFFIFILVELFWAIGYNPLLDVTFRFDLIRSASGWLSILQTKNLPFQQPVVGLMQKFK